MDRAGNEGNIWLTQDTYAQFIMCIMINALSSWEEDSGFSKYYYSWRWTLKKGTFIIIIIWIIFIVKEKIFLKLALSFWMPAFSLTWISPWSRKMIKSVLRKIFFSERKIAFYYLSLKVLNGRFPNGKFELVSLFLSGTCVKLGHEVTAIYPGL